MAQEQDGPDESDMENYQGIPSLQHGGPCTQFPFSAISALGRDTKYLEDKEGAIGYQVYTHHTVVLSNLSLHPGNKKYIRGRKKSWHELRAIVYLRRRLPVMFRNHGALGRSIHHVFCGHFPFPTSMPSTLYGVHHRTNNTFYVFMCIIGIPQRA